MKGRCAGEIPVVDGQEIREVPRGDATVSGRMAALLDARSLPDRPFASRPASAATDGVLTRRDAPVFRPARARTSSPEDVDARGRVRGRCAAARRGPRRRILRCYNARPMRTRAPTIHGRRRPWSPARGLVLVLSLAFAAPWRPEVAHAGPSATEPAAPTDDGVLPDTDPDAVAADEAEPATADEPSHAAGEVEPSDAAGEPATAAATVEADASPSEGGTARASAPDTAETTPAAAPVTTPTEPVQRMPAMERAGWWTLFGAFALGTTAGVLGGLAEREEDRALRLALTIDVDRGTQPLYEDRRAQYERALERGHAFDRAAIGLAVSAGITAAIGVGIFIASRRRAGHVDARARLWGNGVEVRF